METITFKKANNIIELYSTEDDYIIVNIKRFLNRDNDPDDNSIELAEYYQKCLKIIKTAAFKKIKL